MSRRKIQGLRWSNCNSPVPISPPCPSVLTQSQKERNSCSARPKARTAMMAEPLNVGKVATSTGLLRIGVLNIAPRGHRSARADSATHKRRSSRAPAHCASPTGPPPRSSPPVRQCRLQPSPAASEGVGSPPLANRIRAGCRCGCSPTAGVREPAPGKPLGANAFVHRPGQPLLARIRAAAADRLISRRGGSRWVPGPATRLRT